MTSRVLLVAYAIVGVANVVAELTSTIAVVHVTKPLLMPLLALWLIAYWRAARQGESLPRELRWLLVGIAFAWLGDLFLMGSGDAFFIAGIGAFLLMQICYIVAFTRVEGPGLVRAWKIALVPYILVWLGINALVSAGVGALRIPVLIYSVVLITMAVAALDLVIRVPQDKGWRVAIGAAVFVVSDALIALTAFGPLTDSASLSAFVMATYIVAQAMIVTGFAECSASRQSEALL
jgi:uncharacterized membrane protein YhhN